MVDEDELYGLHCDIGRLEVENVRLRKLVDGLTWCCDHHGCRQECPLYDRSETDHCREVSIRHELGMETNA